MANDTATRTRCGLWAAMRLGYSGKMNPVASLLGRIRALVAAKRYRVRIHAVRHMIEEGFEQDLLGALGGKSRILEDYTAERRCLVLGHFTSGEDARNPLHIVCDYSSRRRVDIVTAYLSQKPWWVTPRKRDRLT